MPISINNPLTIRLYCIAEYLDMSLSYFKYEGLADEIQQRSYFIFLHYLKRCVMQAVLEQEKAATKFFLDKARHYTPLLGNLAQFVELDEISHMSIFALENMLFQIRFYADNWLHQDSSRVNAMLDNIIGNFGVDL